MESLDFAKFKQLYDREVVKQMRDNKVPGFSVLITKDGETVYDRSFGNRDWSSGLPTNNDTLYGIASMTKSMTSLAILILQEEGKISIEDSISKYLPVQLDKFEDEPIKIRHLMSHASGIPNLGSYGAQIKNQELTTFNTQHLPIGNWDDFYFHVNDSTNWIYFKPESRYYYNNDAYTLLSQIISKVSGKTYEEFIKERIFHPVEMNRSTFFRQEVAEDNNHASGYSSDFDDNQLRRKPKSHLSGPFQSGAGGLNSSVQELTQYLRMHLNKGEYNENRIISKELISEMYKPHNSNSTSEQIYLLPNKSSYGYGFSVTDFFGYTLIQHGGASGVSGGALAFIPELNITYVHLYNVGWFSSHMMHIALCYLIGRDPYESIPFLKRRDHFKQLRGKYYSYRNLLSIEIIFKDGLVFAKSDVISKLSIPLIQVNPDDNEPMEFYQYSNLGRLMVIFTKIKENEIIIEIKRNIYKKTSYSDDIEPFE